MLSSACLHADNVLDADSSVGLTSGYGGNSYDAAWVQDPDVGLVIECNKVCLPQSPPCTSCESRCVAKCEHVIRQKEVASDTGRCSVLRKRVLTFEAASMVFSKTTAQWCWTLCHMPRVGAGLSIYG